MAYYAPLSLIRWDIQEKIKRLAEKRPIGADQEFNVGKVTFVLRKKVPLQCEDRVVVFAFGTGQKPTTHERPDLTNIYRNVKEDINVTENANGTLIIKSIKSGNRGLLSLSAALEPISWGKDGNPIMGEHWCENIAAIIKRETPVMAPITGKKVIPQANAHLRAAELFQSNKLERKYYDENDPRDVIPDPEDSLEDENYGANYTPCSDQGGASTSHQLGSEGAGESEPVEAQDPTPPVDSDAAINENGEVDGDDEEESAEEEVSIDCLEPVEEFEAASDDGNLSATLKKEGRERKEGSVEEGESFFLNIMESSAANNHSMFAANQGRTESTSHHKHQIQEGHDADDKKVDSSTLQDGKTESGADDTNFDILGSDENQVEIQKIQLKTATVQDTLRNRGVSQDPSGEHSFNHSCPDTAPATGDHHLPDSSYAYNEGRCTSSASVKSEPNEVAPVSCPLTDTVSMERTMTTHPDIIDLTNDSSEEEVPDKASDAYSDEDDPMTWYEKLVE